MNNVNDEITQGLLRRNQLEDLLQDANAERHQEILDQLKDEEAANQVLADKKLKIEADLSAAKTKQAELEKNQAVIQSIIDTALAVVSALPNIPLSIIVGILGAANTAFIASQPIPQFADGGYTGDGGKYEPAGIAHKGEYVVNQEVMGTENGSAMVALLEGMRTGLKGFADGGSVGVPAPSQAAANVTSMNQQPIYVSVQEIRSVGRNVDVLESKAGI